MNIKYIYTEEKLKAAAAKSTSISQVMRQLGIWYENGGMNSHVSRQLRKFKIDTSHFTGQGHNKGKISNKRLPSEKILVKNRLGGRRERTEKLRRAMIESGIPYICNECKSPPMWQGKPLVLPIDHINGDSLDSRKENLQFLCPNCHAQTSTFGAKNIGANS